MHPVHDSATISMIKSALAENLAVWGLSPDTQLDLITVSENATFRARDIAHGKDLVIRAYRPGYHTKQEILSEFHWIEALRDGKIFCTPKPIFTCDGDPLLALELAGEARFFAAFEFMEGKEPEEGEALTSHFKTLGIISAQLHRQTRNWQRPEGFTRKIWDFDAMLGKTQYWGDWRNSLGLNDEGQLIVGRASKKIEEALAHYGQANDRFGLIHADLRLTNLLITADDDIGIIDFDDCGFGWFMYDFAAAISFIEHQPVIGELQEAWVEGYRFSAALSKEDEAILPVMIMARRILLTAWLATHHETPTARELGTGYTDGTVMLAEAFLSEEPS